jgi:DNA-binding NarL/FixJ family response regulator
VILLDMTLPGASGDEIVAQAASVKPDIKVILTSAYNQDMITRTMSQPQIRSFVRKPYRLEELLRALRSCLAS